MSLQGVNSTNNIVQVPASLKANSDVETFNSVGTIIKNSGSPIVIEQKDQIVAALGNATNNGIIKDQDKPILGAVIDGVKATPNNGLSVQDNQTMRGIETKLSNSGDVKLDSKEKSFIGKIIEAIAKFFAKIGEFLSKMFSGGNSNDALNIAAAQGMRSGSSAPTVPLMEDPNAKDHTNEIGANGSTNELLQPLPVDISQLGKTDEQSFDYFMNLAKQKGAKLDLTPGGQKNILTLRNPTNPNANNGKGIYDDKTVVFWVDKDGNKKVEEFQSNADPSAQYAGKNGFNKNPGRIQEGSYMYKTHTEGRLAPVEPVKVERFINGKFEETNQEQSDFLIHSGASENNTGSAGCQTMEPDEFNKFMALLADGSGIKQVSYTIVNVD
jgi:hypothetical protein